MTLLTFHSLPAPGQRWLQGAWRHMGRSPLAPLPYNSNNLNRRNPGPMNGTPLFKSQGYGQKQGGVPLKTEGHDPAIAHGDNSPTDSAADNE